MTSPKEAFFKSAHREALEKFSTSIPGEAARDAALLQFVHEQEEVMDPAINWGEHQRLMGARRILQILYSLHAKDEPPRQTRLPVLRPPS